MSSDESLLDFLEAKATLEILTIIGDMDEPRHVDLRYRLFVSSSTLTDRLKAGVQHAVWRHRLVQQDDGTAKQIYELTELGERIYTVLNERELPENYDKRRGIEEYIHHQESAAINAIRDSLADWI